MPRLATLIPVYNPDAKLKSTLLALNETWHGDLFIVNDGSDPNKVMELVSGVPIKCEILNIEKNVGITKALNVGLHHIMDLGYRYIARIDAGDIPVNNRFVKQFNFLEENQDVGMVGGQVEVVNLDGTHEFFHINPQEHDDIKKAMYLRNAFFHCVVMYRVDVIRKVGFYDETYKVAQDYEFFLRITHGSKVAIINEVLMLDLYNPSGISYARRSEQLRSKLRAQLKYMNISSIYSLGGIAKSLIVIAFPDKLVWAVKKFIKNRLASLKGFT